MKTTKPIWYRKDKAAHAEALRDKMLAIPMAGDVQCAPHAKQACVYAAWLARGAFKWGPSSYAGAYHGAGKVTFVLDSPLLMGADQFEFEIPDRIMSFDPNAPVSGETIDAGETAVTGDLFDD